MLQKLALMLGIGLLLLIQPILPLQAQEAVSLDSSTQGQLTAATPQRSYTFTATADETLRIELIAVTNGLALQAVVLDGNGSLVLAIGNPANAASVQETLPVSAGMSYSLLVSSSNSQVGDFVLRLSVQAPADSCDSLLDEALEAMAGVCAATGRNQACIGNLNVSAMPVAQANPFRFSTIGDITDIAALDTLQLSPLDTTTGELGMVYMLVQANLPDTIPGQNVAMLLYGDMQVQNAAVTDANLAGQYRPMQAFYFTSGIGPARCQDVPDNGILIETPQDSIEITLNINEVNIQLGSTAFLRFSEQQTLDVALLEGIALVSAEGGAQIVSAGQQVRVPLDANLLPIEPPGPPEPVDPVAQQLPTAIALPPAEATATPIAQPLPDATQTTGRPPLSTLGPCTLRTFEPDEFVNVRSGPGTEFAEVSFIDPNDTYTVIGRNAETTWYEIGLGWVAAFVTERGGDCFSLLITYIPPTPTPTPTATPSLPIAGDNEYTVTVDALRRGTQHMLRGAISAPAGDAQDTVRYNIINTTRAGSNAFRLSIRCEGTGVEFATIFFADGSTRDCSPTAYNFIDMGFFTPSTSFTIGFSVDPGNAYVTWSADLGIAAR